MRRPAESDPQSKNLYALVGEQIQARRRHAKWSQSDLARRAGLTRSSVANIELGRQHAPLHTLWAIARALKLELRSLLPLTSDLGLAPEPGDADSSSEATKVGQILEKSGAGLKAFVSSAKE